MNPRFIAVLVLIFALCLCLDLISQFTYQRKPINEIKTGFNRTVLRVFVLILVTIGSTLFWHHMPWKEGLYRGGRPHTIRRVDLAHCVR